MPERKTLLVRMDPAVHEALARWASDELRSTNAHIELLLRSALCRPSATERRRLATKRATAEDRTA